MHEVFHNWCEARYIINCQPIFGSLCMIALESLKDIVKEWIDCVNLNIYSHILQHQLCEEVTHNFYFVSF